MKKAYIAPISSLLLLLLLQLLLLLLLQLLLLVVVVLLLLLPRCCCCCCPLVSLGGVVPIGRVGRIACSRGREGGREGQEESGHQES